MIRYSIFYQPKYIHKQQVDPDAPCQYKWRWLERDFCSIRTAIRYARNKKIFKYAIYPDGVNKISLAVYEKGC